MDELAIKDALKALLKKMKDDSAGPDVEKARVDFKGLLAEATPLLIAQAEQELVAEGFTQSDLVSACDIHLELFRESLEKEEITVPKGHPIARFQEDHRIILDLMEELRGLSGKIKKLGAFDAAAREITAGTVLIDKLLDAENHNVRQENTLFPLLERHGLEQPPAIMWMEHTEMKEDKKRIKLLLSKKEETDFATFSDIFEATVIHLVEKFAAHTLKEKNILYAAALEVLSDEEWKDIKEECDNLGYFAAS